MSAPGSSRQRYLAVLGFRSEGELVTYVTGSIRRAIREQRGDIIPVAVSAAAQAFDVRPEPIVAVMPRDGAIQFDALEGKFVIRINQGMEYNSGYRIESDEDRSFPDLSLYYRSRFTYAHEFAHRFFFVSTDSRWRRAIDIVTQGLQRDALRSAIRNLSNYEESLCNRVAGDVLVPETHLVRVFGDALGTLGGLHQTLRRAAHAFRVSQECMLVRIKRAVLNAQLICPSNLCIFIVTRSDHKGGGARSRRDLRIREAVMPTEISGVRIRSIFPGLAIRNLGQGVLSTAEAVLLSSPGSQPQPIDLEISLATADGISAISPRLTGWASQLYTRGGGREFADGLLLWGLLKPV